jgi:hypothetical protein
MVSTFTTNVNMEVPARGDYVATWDTPLDLWATYMDAIRGSTTTVSTTGGNTNLTQAQQNVMRLQVNGALISNATITLLSGKGCRLIVWNNTSGAFTLKIISGGGGSQVTITQGNVTEIIHDGTNVTTPTVIGGGTVTQVNSSGYITGGGFTSSGTLSLGSMSAANKLMGSGASGATITDITLGTNLSMSGTTLNALATAAVTSVATSGYVTGGTITSTGTISLGSMSAVSKLLGSSASVSTITDITVGTGLTMTASTLSNSGVTSAVAGSGIGVSGATGAVTITNNGVRTITAGTQISTSGTTTTTVNVADLSAVSSLLGSSASVATPTTISLGSGLAMSSSTLNTTGMVKLAGGTVTSVATLDLTLTSGYASYCLVISKFVPVTADQGLLGYFSIDGGATYKNSAGNYGYVEWYVTTAAPTSVSGVSGTIGGLSLLGATANGGGAPSASTTWIYPGISSDPCAIITGFSGSSTSSTGYTECIYLGFTGTADHIRLASASGNISSITYSLYGVN